MRVGLVSPYSWTYPGGVTRHVEALAAQLRSAGHEVLVLAPFDPDDALSARLHRGARPAPRAVPEGTNGDGFAVPGTGFVALGRTVGIPANGAVSNLAATPYAVSTMRRELAAFAADVVHVQEPVVPAVAWDALCSTRSPLVGTFHTHSTNRIAHGYVGTVLGGRRRMNHLRVRIAVSEAAAWTGRRFYGGRYRVIPNGVHLAADGDPPRGPRVAGEPLHVAFVGQAVERKGLPVLLRAFEALREQVPVRLTIIGATDREVAPVLHDARGVTVLGGVDDAAKRAALREADVLCAPSLGGESFGMVLTEAFAAGTPVVASAIAGYADVVRDGVDGLLVPPGDATALAHALRELALDEPRRAALARGAAGAAQRFAWPRVAEQVVQAYEDALAVPEPAGALRRVGVRTGALPADGGPPAPPRCLPPLVPTPTGVVALSSTASPADHPRPGRSRLAIARRVGLAAGALAALALAVLALGRIGVDEIGASLLASSPPWVLAGLGVMAASLLLRSVAWRAILRAALPGVRVSYGDAFQGTAIGVLMSATLPARLGEPSRAVIVARRLGRIRERVPVVLGTIVSQTLLNLLALALLGAAMLSTVEIFTGTPGIVLAALGPAVVALGLLAAPWLLGRHGGATRSHRVEALLRTVRGALAQVRDGLRVFGNPRLGATAAAFQLAAWGLQLLSCYLLFIALGLDDRAGLGAAAAVLFAVNVTAVLPATPSNVGVFQFACVLVLGVYGVGQADALAYGIVLQAVEVATAVALGSPALVKEGLSWREVRVRALHASPVHLDPLPGQGSPERV
jgi:phosphatidylinositol alpha-mannosyltransferase